MRKKLMLLVAMFGCLGHSFAGYVPITVTSGFNADVIANGVGPAANSSTPFDILNEDALIASDWVLNAGDEPPNFSLPASGVINSASTPGLSFDLASYSANNVLLLDTNQNSGTIGFSATGYGQLFLLVAGTNDNISFSATINFDDGSQQTINNLIAKNWTSETEANYAISGVGRIRIPINFMVGSSAIPRIYQVPLNIEAANINKTITGISLSAPSVLSYETMGVFAVTGVTPCGGAPATASVVSTDASVCVGIDFTLSLNTIYSDAGIGYPWQSSTDDINWVNISVVGNQPTATLTQSMAHYYRCVISCVASGLSVATASTFVDQNTALACYCTPIYTLACDGTSNSTFIDGVTLTGDNSTSLNNTGTGCSSESFADFSASVPAVSVTPLQSYSLSLSTNTTVAPYVSVWIDLNNDGFFDPVAERVGTTGNNQSQTVDLYIPLSTITGNHRMRIRAAWYSFSGVSSPCDEYFSGETEDYMIYLLPPPSCIYPLGVTSTPQSLSSTLVNWVSNAAISYDYVLDQNNANTPVSGSSINNTADTFVNLSGLVSGTEYYFHIRSHCSATDSSVWLAVPVLIADPCGATALTIGQPYNGDNTLYPTIPSPASCGGTANFGYDHARLFKFTSTTGNPVKISTCGSSVSDYFRVYSGTCGNFVCIGGSTTESNCNAQYFTFQPLANSTYYVLWGVSGNFSMGQYTIEVFETASNDDARGALSLTVGAGCSEPVYSNETATTSPNEPVADCSATENIQPVWFKFVAPASGSVRISTDEALGTMADSRIGLFSATDSSNYSTFNLLSCDDNNGVNGSGSMSIIYATDLIPGSTYYIEVDNNFFTSPGTFCITVDELSASMLPSDAEDCGELQLLTGFNDQYKGWVTLTDDAGKLVALVRNPFGGATADYTGAITVKDGATRQIPTGTYYLNRNYLISNGNVDTPVDLKLFFTMAEFANFNSTLNTMGLMASMSDLNVWKQSGYDCAADVDPGLGTLQTLPQIANNNVNGVGSIQVSISGFSNFYISGANFIPLAIKLKSIEAKNAGKFNQISWTTVTEEEGDYFELERSADGIRFNTIARIDSHKKPSNYVYSDNDPLAGVNYYRLKMIDLKGKVDYSKTVQAKLTGSVKMGMDVYPNPVNKSLTLKVFGTKNGTVTLTDISGRAISTNKMNGSELQIDMSALARGFYLLHYLDENLNQVVKVNKQ